ncbi:MAG: undecaprenyl diphosphate synthase [Saprospiraceae bacterium]|jgi:undecaprenyl diphosphate synthase
MATLEDIDKNNLPQHVAVIMDGNGRWAKLKGKLRIFGHRSGVKSVKSTIEAAAKANIKFITLYAFSTENWNRPQDEVDGLMELLVNTIKSETKTLNKNNIRLLSIGDRSKLPDDCQLKLKEAIEETSGNDHMTLVLALNYSAKWEIIEATKNIADQVKRGEINVEDIDNEKFSSVLSTSGIPDPELMIRTSGEHRISNFLLWQLAYAELYFTPVMWPDFSENHFYDAIVSFQSRERRFGKTSEQLTKEKTN